MNQKTVFMQVDGKEYLLQHSGRYYRCISWHPHYIMTEWVMDKDKAIEDGDRAIEEYYKKRNIELA